jgi:hypothetical protein
VRVERDRPVSLVGEVIDRVPALRVRHAKQAIRDALIDHVNTSPRMAKTTGGF